MTFPSTGSLYHPGAVFELPGFDPDWATVPKHEHETADSSGLEISELELPIAQGESLPFAAMLFLQGSGSGAVSVQVNTPVDSIGGFMIQFVSSGNTYNSRSFGADRFNTNITNIRNGTTGTLESWHPVRIEGMVVASMAGLLKLTVTGSTTIKAGSFLKGYRQHDSRPV